MNWLRCRIELPVARPIFPLITISAGGNFTGDRLLHITSQRRCRGPNDQAIEQRVAMVMMVMVVDDTCLAGRRLRTRLTKCCRGQARQPTLFGPFRLALGPATDVPGLECLKFAGRDDRQNYARGEVDGKDADKGVKEDRQELTHDSEANTAASRRQSGVGPARLAHRREGVGHNNRGGSR